MILVIVAQLTVGVVENPPEKTGSHFAPDCREERVLRTSRSLVDDSVSATDTATASPWWLLIPDPYWRAPTPFAPFKGALTLTGKCSDV